MSDSDWIDAGPTGPDNNGEPPTIVTWIVATILYIALGILIYLFCSGKIKLI